MIKFQASDSFHRPREKIQPLHGCCSPPASISSHNVLNNIRPFVICPLQHLSLNFRDHVYNHSVKTFYWQRWEGGLSFTVSYPNLLLWLLKWCPNLQQEVKPQKMIEPEREFNHSRSSHHNPWSFNYVQWSFYDVPWYVDNVPRSSCDVPGISHYVQRSFYYVLENSHDVSWSSHNVP